MRRIFIHAVLITFLAITCFDIAAGVEHWPFSQYPMYSTLQNERDRLPALYGVTASGEFAIPVQALRPFNEGRLLFALRRLDGESLDRALADLRRIYDRNRGSGRYNGPPISALKLYLVTWDLDKGPQPVEKLLVRESR